MGLFLQVGFEICFFNVFNSIKNPEKRGVSELRDERMPSSNKLTRNKWAIIGKKCAITLQLSVRPYENALGHTLDW